jgi:hypothetical protein
LVYHCIGWAWYLSLEDWKLWESGPQYTRIHDTYFDAFTLPPFNWDFEFSIYFELPLWDRLLTFNLGEFELLGMSLTVQLLTVCFSLLRRTIAAHYSGGIRSAVTEKIPGTFEVVLSPLFKRTVEANSFEARRA